MRQTEPWWTCNKCNIHLVRVGKGDFHTIIDEHRKTACGPCAGCYIVQVEQRKDVK